MQVLRSEEGFFIGLTLWSQSHLMISADVAEYGDHAKPRGQTGSQEHTCRYLEASFKLKGER